uniref:Uncharacterized protein n=1 Tax=Anguilla anguilla TaxID=7936 RepID=A0A0E9RYR7_ANGAN
MFYKAVIRSRSALTLDQCYVHKAVIRSRRTLTLDQCLCS